MKSFYNSYDGFHSSNEKEYHKHRIEKDKVDNKVLSIVRLTVTSKGPVVFELTEYPTSDTRLTKSDLVINQLACDTLYATHSPKMGEVTEWYELEFRINLLSRLNPRLIRNYKTYLLGKAVDYLNHNQVPPVAFNALKIAEAELNKRIK